MKLRITLTILAGLVLGLLLVPHAAAQEPTIEDVRAKFADLTRSEIEAMGYTIEPACVDASILPAPAREELGLSETAAMGVHAVNESMFDDQVDALEPEVIVLGPNDEVWAVEWEAVAETENPVVLGQEMHRLEEGHPGMEFPHYALHLWFIDNPAGQFADFNPAVSCMPETMPTTGSPQAGGLFNVWLLLSLGLLAVGGGIWLRRRTLTA